MARAHGSPWVAMLTGLLLVAPAVHADMYRWVDEAGTVHYADGRDSVPERFRPQATRLEYRPSPGASGEATAGGAADSTVIAFVPGKRIYVTAQLNGRASARLMVDTGADRTVVTPRALSAAGLSLRTGGVSGRIQGATGTAEAQAYEVDSVQVGNARVAKLLVVSHDVSDSDGDGLLGRDFLDHFTVTIDNAAGQLTLAPK